MKHLLKKSFLYKSYLSFKTGKILLNHPSYISSTKLSKKESSKSPYRTDVINLLVDYLNREITYLEIGVRNPQDNFNLIEATTKYSVDPGLEFDNSHIDFPLTSDLFFQNLENGKVLTPETKFDIIFIDGLHLAPQVDKDIQNALKFIKDDGFIVLHDCNPPTEWHARLDYSLKETPATNHWNGTTWKAFQKWRYNSEIYSCCVDTDWGVGIISKTQKIGNSCNPTNEFYEFDYFDNNRNQLLNLVSFEELKNSLNANS